MVKTEFKMKINYKRALSTTQKGSAIGGFFWDKDDYNTISTGFSAFNANAELISTLSVGDVLYGTGNLVNSNQYSKTNSDTDNNAREIKIYEITGYDSNENGKWVHTALKKAKKEYTKPNKNNDEEQPKQSNLIIEEDDLPF